jgi:hypothetical protein
VGSLTNRIPELDGARGLAILLVVAYHYFYAGVGPPNQIDLRTRRFCTMNIAWKGRLFNDGCNLYGLRIADMLRSVANALPSVYATRAWSSPGTEEQHHNDAAVCALHSATTTAHSRSRPR